MIDSLVQVLCLETDAEERILIEVGISGNINTYLEKKLRKTRGHLMIDIGFMLSSTSEFRSQNLFAHLNLPAF